VILTIVDVNVENFSTLFQVANNSNPNAQLGTLREFLSESKAMRIGV